MRILLAGLLTAATMAVPAPAVAATATTTITPDPSYQGAEWQGWGTSLAWMAEATGGYPDEIRNRLVDLVFGADGLNLNIARFDIGGGNAPTVRPYLRPGGAVPGFWKADRQYTPAEKDWWNPADEGAWDWDADPNQRWWVEQIKDKVTHWEAFSNSPPYFQTVSGYVSGGFTATADQIRPDRVDEFAQYLTRVAGHLEQAHGITFDAIEPLNEPNTDYWSTTLGADGQPTGGRQEGAHAGPAAQSAVIAALARAYRGNIAAPDETNPGTMVTDHYGWTAEARAAVDRLNVHTYGTGQRTSVRDIAKAERKPLWMSEVEGSWGHDYTSMDSGLGMAQRIVDDIRELEPSAWVLWQPIEDADNMRAEGNLQWGEIHVPFDCAAGDTLTSCPIRTNTKYDTIRNFTHYVRPGDHFVKVSDTRSLAAVNRTGATVVHVNPAATAETVTLDLSKFATVRRGATVTPIVTSADGKLVAGSPVRVGGRRAVLTVPAQSVTTFLVSGVSGAAAPHLVPGRSYRLQGVASGKSLAPGPVIRTSSATAADQLWTFQPVGDAYRVTNAGTGQPLDATGSLWRVSTTGDGTYTLINADARRLLDVNGGATADGAPVGLYQPTSAGNQRWSVIDEHVGTLAAARTYTVPGRAPALPATVSDGRHALPVVWKLPPGRAWRKPGLVRVTGTATDVLGRTHRAVAEVTVDVFTATLPARAKTFAGGQPVLPSTVVAVGRHGGRADVPVTWQAARFPQPGVVTVGGSAQVVPGADLTASVRVQVTTPVDAPLTGGVSVTASYTEPGYSTAGLTNGDTTDKAWSNWKSADRDPSETLVATLPAATAPSRLSVHFYRDNASGGGLPQSVRAGVPDASGTCAVSGPVIPVGVAGPLAVDVPVPDGVTGSVCLVLTTVPDGYLTVAELRVSAKAPGVGTDASVTGITVDGVPLRGFDPAVLAYRTVVDHPGRVAITASPADPYATVTVTRAGTTRIVTVTSEDGSARREYRITVAPRRH
ncbi:glycoside hydrolase [Actinoplanes oblitus]|uniref:Glycoside hydrolase n=1 Tax=Actinoplanes oblitus TaxID=3040509 RepID=A0ABY8WM10_9ACTN|nr:RICIN domain-containing protein [Actinoplanes oblitus]WIM98512.1 glycoside hydrolase [Actinoplanes oblitus]